MIPVALFFCAVVCYIFDLRLAAALFAVSYFIMTCTGCVQADPECEDFSTTMGSNYKYNSTTVTPEGVQYDVQGQSFDTNVLDRIVNEVYSCLQVSFANIPKYTDEMARTGWCAQEKIKFFPKKCFKVIIPNNWNPSCDGTQQLLADDAPQESCEAKGLPRDYEKCPCRWRAGTQDDEKIRPMFVTTPSLYLLKDPIARYLTSCSLPWSVPEIRGCLNPSTGPLDLNEGPLNLRESP